MPRWAFRALLLLGLVALAVGPTALAQQPATIDDLAYRDRSADGKVVEIKTETKESAKGIEVIVVGKTKTVVSPADVIRYEPGALVGVGAGDLSNARAAERNKTAAEAQALYADLLKKAGPGAPERTVRHLMFRDAMLTAKIADQKTGDDFAPDATKAADRLATVAKMAKKSWEVYPASKAAARLYGEVGKFDRAAAVLGELAAVPELPRDLKYEARLGEAAALIRGGSGPAADGVLDALEKDAEFPTGPLKERLAVLRVAAKLPTAPGTGKPAEAAKLEEAIAAAKDPAARAVGYNFLGDLYAAHGQTRDAMWSYLWTDTVYNQDRDEQVFAVRRLVDLMEKAGDKDRADQFRERLARVR
jgi:hypothetical protein